MFLEYKEQLEKNYVEDMSEVLLNICPNIPEEKRILAELEDMSLDDKKAISCEVIIELDEQLKKIDVEGYSELILQNKVFFNILFNDLSSFSKECLENQHGMAILNHFDNLTYIDKFNFSVKQLFKIRKVECPFNKI